MFIGTEIDQFEGKSNTTTYAAYVKFWNSRPWTPQTLWSSYVQD